MTGPPDDRIPDHLWKAISDGDTREGADRRERARRLLFGLVIVIVAGAGVLWISGHSLHLPF
jgi:hypothetical protein